MTKISVTRALSQLKVLDKRIDKAIRECQPAAVVIGKQMPPGYADEAELKKTLKGNLDRPRDLIQHRAALKRAIVMSNATTEVTVAGRKMTVAEAIEMKASIEKQKDLQEMLQQYMLQANTQYNRHHEKAVEKADKTAEGVLSGTDKQADEYKKFVETYMENNGPRLIKPDNLDTAVENLDDSIARFEHEVDYVLSEINATTFLEVDDAVL